MNYCLLAIVQLKFKYVIAQRVGAGLVGIGTAPEKKDEKNRNEIIKNLREQDVK